MVKIERKTLLEGIKKVMAAVSSNTSMPILKGALIECQNNSMKITATNLELAISVNLVCETEMFGEKYVVDAKIFHDIINKLNGSEITLQYNKEEESLQINSGKSKFNIKTMIADEFPEFNVGLNDKYNSVIIEGHIFEELIKKTVPFTSNDEARPILQGVLVELNKNQIKAVSLDGYRLSYSANKIENDVETNLVINSNVLSNIAKSIEGDVEINFSDDVNNLRFITGNTTLYTRILEGNYIKYQDILKPNNSTMTITINTNDLKQALDRINVVSKIGGLTPCVMEIKDKKIELKTKNEIGNVLEILEPLEIEGEENMKIAFNPSYFIQGLSVINQETCKIKLKDSLSPAYIVSEEEEYIYLFLPIRLS